MKQSRSLIYLITENYKKSLWMPWELGVFDGMCEGLNIAVFPLLINDDSDSLIEYLKLYPYIDSAKPKDSIKKVLWVNESEKRYCRLKDWLKGDKPYLHN